MHYISQYAHVKSTYRTVYIQALVHCQSLARKSLSISQRVITTGKSGILLQLGASPAARHSPSCYYY